MAELSSATATAEAEAAIPATSDKLNKILLFNFIIMINLNLLLELQPRLRKVGCTIRHLSAISGQKPAETVEYICHCLARQSLRAKTFSVF
jgi:hypothetical protein